MIVRNTRELGGFLREAREEAGLTQADLAARLGVRRQRVLYLERGEGQLQVAFVLAVLKALGLELSVSKASEAAQARAPHGKPAGKAAGKTLAPYSIDDIADGGRK